MAQSKLNIKTISTGFLLVQTAPVAGTITVGDQRYGNAPVVIQLVEGNYGVSFSDISRYETPAPEKVTIRRDTLVIVVGEYKKPGEGPPPGAPEREGTRKLQVTYF